MCKSVCDWKCQQWLSWARRAASTGYKAHAINSVRSQKFDPDSNLLAFIIGRRMDQDLCDLLYASEASHKIINYRFFRRHTLCPRPPRHLNNKQKCNVKIIFIFIRRRFGLQHTPMWWGAVTAHQQAATTAQTTQIGSVCVRTIGWLSLLDQKQNILAWIFSLLQVTTHVKFVHERSESDVAGKSIKIRCAPGDPWISNTKSCINIIVVHAIVPKWFSAMAGRDRSGWKIQSNLWLAFFYSHQRRRKRTK